MMDKQLMKLFCEALKMRYKNEFEKFKELDIVKAELLKSEAEFLRELHKSLRDKLYNADLDHPDMLLEELDKIENDKNALGLSYKNKIEKIRIDKNDKVGYERSRALVLAEKLTLIETKLNTLGVTIKIEDSKIIFKHTNGHKR